MMEGERFGMPRRRGRDRIREIPVRLIVPNLITVLSICAGLSGIRLAFEGRYELAVVMVLVAAILDGLDGRAARLLKASSKFGAQMDSLADVVNFGVAPALVLYAVVLAQAGSFGWIAALIFAIACALRLARFNVMAEEPDLPAWQADYFVGIPAPAGALLVLLPVYIGFIGFAVTPAFAFVSCVFAFGIALLMVSRLRIYSGKTSQRIRRDLVLPALLLAVLYVLLMVNFTWITLAGSALAYLAFIPFSLRAYRKRELAEAAKLSEVKAAQPDVPSAS